MTDTDWKLEGLCRLVNPDLWFPEKGQNATRAKAICAACPVTTQCRTEALATDERHGIWGGLSENDRTNLRRRRNRARLDALSAQLDDDAA